MALILNDPLAGRIDTSQPWRWLAAGGQTLQAPSIPAAGIPGYFEPWRAPDGAPCMRVSIYGSDGDITFGGNRAEILGPFEPTGLRYYSAEIWIPSGSGENWTGKISCMQIHDFPDASEGAGGSGVVKFPPFECVINGGAQAEIYVPKNTPDETTSLYRMIGAEPFPVNRWVKYGFWCNWQTDNSAWVEAYIDGRVIASEWYRPFRYIDAVGPYLQVGLYDLFHFGFSGTRRAYLRNIKIGDASESVASMFGVQTVPSKII